MIEALLYAGGTVYLLGVAFWTVVATIIAGQIAAYPSPVEEPSGSAYLILLAIFAVLFWPTMIFLALAAVAAGFLLRVLVAVDSVGRS